MATTMIVVTTVSRRVGQVTLDDLGPHLLQKLEGIRPRHLNQILAAAERLPSISFWLASQPWQEWRNSNPQPPVLETGALAS